jgi:arylsulfatase A
MKYKRFRIMLLALSTTALAVAEMPNIVIIFNDDQGYQDLGCYGSPDIKTPRVDQLAKEGMRFTDFYVASPVCSASRAALLTGCYPQRVGVPGVFWPNRKGGLDPQYETIADTLKRAGYATAAVGKWHLGDSPQYLPTRQGFDSYYGIPYSNDMFPAQDMKYSEDCRYREGMTQATLKKAFEETAEKKKSLKKSHWLYGQPVALKDKVPLMRNEECIEFPADQSTITRRYADEGIRFISESVKAGKPFFLYLANSMPHVPLFASPDFKGRSEDGPYGDTIEEIDFNTGRIMDLLKKLGIEGNTIVIFSSDNGPWLEKGDQAGSAKPLFEGKFTSFEGGVRVPCIIRWPGRIPEGSTCSEIASTIDLLPTLAHIVGVQLSDSNLDGKDILDLWTKEGAKTPHAYFFYVNQGQAVRSGDWKYHKKEVFKVQKTARKASGTALYNLNDDIGESTNVIDEYPEIAERLALVLEGHLQEIRK